MPPLEAGKLDGFLTSHLLSPALLRADDFYAFMLDRQARLLTLIEQATGKLAYSGTESEEGEDAEVDADAVEAELTMSAA